MAVARIKTSSIVQGFPKSRSLLAGNAAYIPTSFESIQTVTVGSGGTSSISFSSIPSTYKHLQLRIISQETTGTGAPSGIVKFNGDSGTNYTYHSVYGNGSSALTGALTGQTQSYSLSSTTSGYTNIYCANIIDILDYANTSKYKTTRSLVGWDANGSGYILFISTLWQSTAAINSITITPSNPLFSQYSSFALYGIKG